MSAAPPLSAGSMFVTVVALSFFLLSACLASVTAVVAMLMVAFHRTSDFIGTMQRLRDAPHPDLWSWFSQNWELSFLLLVAIFTSMMLASLGLFVRSNKARLAFVGLLMLGIAESVADFGAWIDELSVLSARPSPKGPDAYAFEWFDTIAKAMAFMESLESIALIALFAWIIKRLCSSPYVDEFR